VRIPDDEQRTGQLRERYLALLLDGLRSSGAAPLPGPAPRREEFARRWGPGANGTVGGPS